jgi:hypothetical protein
MNSDLPELYAKRARWHPNLGSAFISSVKAKNGNEMSMYKVLQRWAKAKANVVMEGRVEQITPIEIVSRHDEYEEIARSTCDLG